MVNYCLMSRVSVWEEEKVLEMDDGGGHTHVVSLVFF